MRRSMPQSESHGGVNGTNGFAAVQQRHKAYRPDSDSSNRKQPIPLNQHGSGLGQVKTTQKRSQNLLHLDECDDPDCLDLEQLKELQKSLDRFTDYDHYERCCDEGGRHHHHCSHGLVVEDDGCCADDMDICKDDDEAGKSVDCEECVDDCEECAEEHQDCYEEVDVCEEDCEQCEEECEERGHGRQECPQNHPTTRDNCLDACNISLPLLGPTNDFDLHGYSNTIPDFSTCTNDCSPLPEALPSLIKSDREPTFDTALDHWQTFVQAHHCAPDPCVVGQFQQFTPPQHLDPAFGFSFGCDPMNPANHYPWQLQQPHCAVLLPSNNSRSNMTGQPSINPPASVPTLSAPSSSSQASVPSSSPDPVSKTVPERICQWVMPCGSICGASFGRTEDLKKHVKNSHGVKGTVTCGWKDCSSSFATEAALTGHISKKHLSFDEEGPWKCTYPNCGKSFMYKQVRDDHLASHNGGNRMHCPICHQWLNAEGSNFRRHMASHGPKNEHMKCRFEHLGCRKRFPRVDNLRRHEGCCKFGKRAQGVHHHHHKVHIHQ